MKRSEIVPMPRFFDRYINLIDDIDLFEGFARYTPEHVFAETEKLAALGDHVYAEGKWTAKDILQHVIDNERIMAYRALRFSRNDRTQLPGYEEEILAANTTAAHRTIDDLMDEFSELRRSTITLFKNMDATMLTRVGNANQTEITPLALGFVILGHPVHHMNVLRERYFPLL
ncbi:DinB superfamily protein [Dyadobacter soli]|uniref:DinB superfamily protein n=1 Tax=Dyadobacter soli TaxID=659014 RepID=A0A1G6YF16_9BACT|nr:DinB family protein [Dyadobacter soli]SDD88950.1 DinB superfamily protein [Dyadobacter soli]